jgi:hypothetical protein
MLVTVSADELIARTSAVLPFGGGKVVTSTTLNLSRVTLAPVLFVMRRLTDIVPNVEWFGSPGVVSLTRFGGNEGATV